MHELAKVPYIPTETDVLRCRSRTTGIHAQKLQPWGAPDPRLLQIIDVGGTFYNSVIDMMRPLCV